MGSADLLSFQIKTWSKVILCNYSPGCFQVYFCVFWKFCAVVGCLRNTLGYVSVASVKSRHTNFTQTEATKQTKYQGISSTTSFPLGMREPDTLECARLL